MLNWKFEYRNSNKGFWSLAADRCWDLMSSDFAIQISGFQPVAIDGAFEFLLSFTNADRLQLFIVGEPEDHISPIFGIPVITVLFIAFSF